MDEKKKALAVALRADPEWPIGEICKTLNIPRATFYRYWSLAFLALRLPGVRISKRSHLIISAGSTVRG
jgi:hypothetical protein